MHPNKKRNFVAKDNFIHHHQTTNFTTSAQVKRYLYICSHFTYTTISCWFCNSAEFECKVFASIILCAVRLGIKKIFCGNVNSVYHAPDCKLGGFVFMCHNAIRDTAVFFLQEVLILYKNFTDKILRTKFSQEGLEIHRFGG